MLILILRGFCNLLPNILGSLTNALMPCIIICAGIVLLFASVGVKISNNLGATVVNGIFRAIGYFVRELGKLLKFIFQKLIWICPIVFHKTRGMLIQKGVKPWVSNLLAAAVVLLMVALII